MTDIINCTECGTTIDEPVDLPIEKRKPCPKCGSTMRNKTILISETLTIKDGPDSQGPCQYDVSISYASEDAGIAEVLSNRLTERGVSVFLDRGKRHELWGKDLEGFFKEIFGRKSAFVLILLSEHYVRKEWTDYEFECAKREAEKRMGEFILPIRLDETVKKGLKSGIGYMHYYKDGPDSIIEELTKKLENSPRSNFSSSTSKKRRPPAVTQNGDKTHPDKLESEWLDDVCMDGPFKIKQGDYVLIPLNLHAKDRMKGTLDETEGNSFNWYIVDERNMIEFKRKKEFTYERGGEGEGAYLIKSWSIRRNGPWYLILDTYGKQHPRNIAVHFRKKDIS